VLIAPMVPVGLATIASDGTGTIEVAGLVAVLVLLAYTNQCSEDAPTLACTARSIAWTAVALLAVRHVPACWMVLERIVQVFSRMAFVLAQVPLRVGPTFSGFWEVFPFLVLAFGSRAIQHGHRSKIIYITILNLLILLNIYYNYIYDRLLLFVLSNSLALPEPHKALAISPGIGPSFSAILLLPPLLIAARFLIVPAQTTVREFRGTRVAPALLGAIGTALAGFVLTLNTPLEWPVMRKPVIGFHDAGSLNWTKPQSGEYGLIKAGMFGMLRSYLEAAGYAMVDLTGQLRAETLTRLDTLVVINPVRSFSEAEQRAVWDFARRGGSLLVLGDHTDLMGMQEPLNRLLEPVGIRFGFDSAFALRYHWRCCQELRPHALTQSIMDDRETQIGTGASLSWDLRHYDIRPIILGRYAFSDAGNRSNGGQGAFLGDYRYQFGERIGDIVLVAEARYGLGRVLVFGDTSSFETLALPNSYRFVERTFRYLVSSRREKPWVLPVSVALLAVGVVALGMSRIPGGLSLLFPLLLLVADASHGFSPRAAARPLDRAKVGLLDVTHASLFSPQLFEKDSIAGVFMALARAGYLPLALRDFQSLNRGETRLLMCIEPIQSFSPREIRELKKFLQAGGCLIVAAAPSDLRASNQLAALGGMKFTSTPLGAVTIGPSSSRAAEPDQRTKPTVDKLSPQSQGQVSVAKKEPLLEFVDARPVVATSGSELTVHAASDGYVLVAESPVGEGRLVAFGDGQFFRDDNLEGEYQYRAGNVEFLRQVLEGGLKKTP
jgi:hypothetical protein